MGVDKYKLKWSKHESNVLSAFKELLETEALSDVTLFCDGETALESRVARFFLTHFAMNGENIPNCHLIAKCP
jgi:hypothetical protein